MFLHHHSIKLFYTLIKYSSMQSFQLYHKGIFKHGLICLVPVEAKKKPMVQKKELQIESIILYNTNCFSMTVWTLFLGEPAVLPPSIAFSASRSSPLGPVREETIITYDEVFLNLGDSFDIFSSHFVCKVNGTYLFTAHILGTQNNDAYAWIMFNGQPMVPMHGDHQAGYGTGSNTLIYHLVRDDHVWVQLMKNSSLLNDYSTFSGYLIYKDVWCYNC